MQPTRDKVLDGIKFLLICMVVVGHSLEPSRYSSSIIDWIYSLIYLFHMPLFVLLSGYFSKTINREKFKKGALRQIESYFIASLLVYVLSTHTLNEFINPTQANWYLLSLILWRLIIVVSQEVKMGGGKLLIFSFILSIVTFALPITKGFLMLAWGRTVQFLPFFVIGYLFTADNIDFLRFKSKRILIILVSIIICVTVVFLSCRAFHLLEFHRTSLLPIVDEPGVPSTRLCFLKLFVEISAIVLSLAMLTIRNLPSNICKLGRYTLSIYILQIVIIQYGIRFVPNHS